MAVSTHKQEAVSGNGYNPDKGTILNGGNISGSKFQAKSPLDTVRGLKQSGAMVIDSDWTNEAKSDGTIAYFPTVRTATNTGFIMRGGVGNQVGGVASFNPIEINGSDTTSRPNGNIHKIVKSVQQGTWADRTFDILTGTLVKGTNAGTAYNFVQKDGSTAAIDDAASPTRSTPGEFYILSNFTDFDGTSVSGDGTGAENMMDYSAITGG